MIFPESAPMEMSDKVNALIVDKEGSLGSALAQAFSKETSAVFVSKRKPRPESLIIHIPFSETIPAIPDGTYSYIVYVFGLGNKELLEPLMKKAAFDKVKFFIIVSYEHVPLLSEFLSNMDVYGHTVVIGDVFGEGTGELSDWLYEVKKTKKVALSNMGLNAWYPVFFNDAIASLMDLFRSSHTGKQIYILAPSHPITQLTLSHALQKVDPFLRIDFGGNGKQITSSLPEGVHMLKEYPVIEKIKDYYQHLSIREEPEKTPFSLFATAATERSNKKKKKSSLPFIIYTLMIFVLMPMVLMITTGALGRWLLLSGIDDIKHGAFSIALQKIEAAKSNISFSQFSSDLVEHELSVFGQAARLSQIKQQLSLANVTSNTLEEAVVAAQKIQSVVEGKSLKPAEDTKDGVNSLKNTVIMVQKLQTYDLPKEYRNKLTLLDAYFPLIETTVDALPQLLGADGERKYLVLFQNNTELRPGGGFIGSYGLLTLSHGKFKDFTIHDVYDADGHLQGHVEPPFAIRRYLPLVHLYLRDSNFDVDFVKNAQKASLMLTAETGDTVDGVIGIDLSLVQKIIAALGTVYVPSSQDTVTQDNFFLLTEQRAEKNFFAGSTQKKDFLSALFSAMQTKLLSLNGTSYEKILEGILSGIEEKHMLFAFSNQTLQAPFSVNGFSSALLDSRAYDKATLNDFLGINEANIGIDKVNYFITRKVSHKVLVTDKGQMKESVTLTLTNTSVGQWPGGDYKNYVRFILPKGTTLDNVSIDGKDQKILPAVTDPKVYEAQYFIAPKGLEVEQTEENGKSIFGFLVSVPVKTTSDITISYTLQDTVDVNQSLPIYSLQIFKQPGVDVLPTSLEVAYPQGFSLLKSSEKVESTNSVISWNKDIRKDTLLNISLVKK